VRRTVLVTTVLAVVATLLQGGRLAAVQIGRASQLTISSRVEQPLAAGEAHSY
jgi:hypothetical protein